MMILPDNPVEAADAICGVLRSLPEVKGCRLYGSISRGSQDRYSDIDVEIDVSGVDNGVYLTRLPILLSEWFEVIYTDFAPSLAPGKYIVSAALSRTNPFLLLDIACMAEPHCTTVGKSELSALNDPYTHMMKLFSANVKHYLRAQGGEERVRSVQKMYGRACPGDLCPADEAAMLRSVYHWLLENADEKYRDYVEAFPSYVN